MAVSYGTWSNFVKGKVRKKGEFGSKVVGRYASASLPRMKVKGVHVSKSPLPGSRMAPSGFHSDQSTINCC